jgi:hypothetical protein
MPALKFRNLISLRIVIFSLLEIAVTLIVYARFALPIYQGVTTILAWSVLQVTVLVWMRWYKRTDVPVLPVIFTLYWIYFSLPILFFEKVRFLGTYYYMSDQTAQRVLGMVLIALLSIWIGWEIRNNNKNTPVIARDISPRRLRITAYSIISIQACILFLSITYSDFSMSSIAQIVNGLANIYFALGILYFTAIADRWRVGNIIGILVIVLYALVMSIHTTSLSDMIMPLLVLIVIMIRRFKYSISLALIALSVVVIILHPVRTEYRNTIIELERQRQAVTYEMKIEIYWTVLWSHLTGRHIATYYEDSAEKQTSDRLTLLPIVGKLIEETPERIPFQMGKTFSFILFSPIPRFLYTDKPTAQEANLWFATEYRIIDQEIAKRTMVGISHIGEVYVNFGLMGIPFVFTIFGYILRIVLLPLEEGKENLTRKCVTIALIPNFLFIESTLTGFLVSILYTLLFTNLTIWLLSRNSQELRSSPSSL